MSCDRCKFCKNTTKPETFGRGSKSAKVMFIQDVVTEAESKKGIQFWGKSCDKLRNNIKSVGIDLEDIYWTSVIKCPLPEELYKPTIKESRECSETMLAEISVVDPDIIVPMGNLALKYTLNRSDLTKSRGNAQEVEIEGRNRIVLPMIHPRQALKKPQYKETILKDLESLKLLVDDGMNEVTGVDYRSLETIPEVLSELNRLNKSEWISFDLETTGLDPFTNESKIVCISLTDRDHYGVVIPLYHKETPFTTPEIGTIVKALRVMLENPKTKKIAHNGKFDIKWLESWLGIKVANFCFDTMLAHYIAVSEEPGTQDLKGLAWEYTDMGGYDNALDEYKKKLPEAVRNNYDNIPWKILSTYAVADVDCAIRLKDIFYPMIQKNKKWKVLMSDFLMPASYALKDLEIDGMLMSDEKIEEFSKTYQGEIDRIKEQLESYPEVIEIERERAEKYMEREAIKKIKKADRTEEEQQKFKDYAKYKDPKFSWTSPVQLKELLFDRLGLTTTVRTDKGELSTGEEALIEMSEQHELPLLMMELRKVTTLTNMFIKKLPGMRDNNGRIHPSYKLHGTQTGRLASTDPNFQQMPRKSEVPTLFQYQNEPKSLFISQFNHNPGSIRSIKPTPQGCIVNLDYCLAPDTMVELINNERYTIKSICERVTSGEDLYTYSINPDTEEIEVSKIVAGRQTRKNEPTLKITLDNGDTIISSYNHKFLLRNGKYVPAEELEVGTSLMSLNIDTPYKIISIEPYESMDLYDIEVEKHHNFALTAGVFVHNSQLELRIAGVISGDKVLEEVYKSGIDLHIATASKTFGIPIEEVTKDARTKAKGVGFGRIKSNLVIR